MPQIIDTIRRIGIFGFECAQLLDIAGPADVFEIASKEVVQDGGRAIYAVDVLALDGAPFCTSGGIRIAPEHALSDEPFDTLILAGGSGVLPVARRAEVQGWLQRAAQHTRRIASVCTGAWLLAEAGLLQGRQATTHWMACDALAAAHPGVDVQADAIFVVDGPIWTSAGITSGIDLALAMVEADHGRDLALRVARILVMFLKRPGGQSQFSAPLRAQMAERGPVRKAQLHAVAAPGADLSIEALAAIAGMSRRNFARVFTRETGVTPGDYVEGVRIDAARRLLEESDLTADQIARRCGFGEPDTMRRAFLRRIGVAPRDYRARFRTSVGPESWPDVA